MPLGRVLLSTTIKGAIKTVSLSVIKTADGARNSTFSKRASHGMAVAAGLAV